MAVEKSIGSDHSTLKASSHSDFETDSLERHGVVVVSDSVRTQEGGSLPSMDRYHSLESRHPGMDSRHPGMESRYPGIDSRHTGMETRDRMDSRHSRIDSRYPGIDSRHTGMETRDRMDSRHSRIDSRYPGVESRHGMESRHPGMGFGHTMQVYPPSNLVVNYAMQDNSNPLSPIWNQMQYFRTDSETSSNSEYITSYIENPTPVLRVQPPDPTGRKVGADSGHGESTDEERGEGSGSASEGESVQLANR